MIYTGDDYQGGGGLVDYIPREYIPKCLNGPCECLIPEGRPVPKNLYKYDHVGKNLEIYSFLKRCVRTHQGNPFKRLAQLWVRFFDYRRKKKITEMLNVQGDWKEYLTFVPCSVRG